MATNYNITQKQYNGSDYDTLYPKNTSQQVLLNDSALATALGLSGTPTVNDVLDIFANGGIISETISYTGDGNYGASHPTEITFTYKPLMVWIYLTGVVSGTGYPGILISPIFYDGGTTTIYRAYDDDMENLAVGWNNKTLQLYSTNGSLNQFNGTTTYKAIALYDITNLS